MKSLFSQKSLQPEKLVNKFFYWGLILLILIGLNFWGKRGMYFLVGTSGKLLQIYNNIMGVIYNISTIVIPIISIILFKSICDIIYFFIEKINNSMK